MTSSASLLTLPPEIRLQINAHILIEPQDHYDLEPRRINLRKEFTPPSTSIVNKFYRRPYSKTRRAFHSLILTCRQLHLDVTAVYYRENAFAIRLGDDVPPSIRNFTIETLGERNRSFIREIVIVGSEDDVDEEGMTPMAPSVSVFDKSTNIARLLPNVEILVLEVFDEGGVGIMNDDSDDDVMGLDDPWPEFARDLVEKMESLKEVSITMWVRDVIAKRKVYLELPTEWKAMERELKDIVGDSGVAEALGVLSRETSEEADARVSMQPGVIQE
jgi:hypothetical protein